MVLYPTSTEIYMVYVPLPPTLIRCMYVPVSLLYVVMSHFHRVLLCCTYVPLPLTLHSSFTVVCGYVPVSLLYVLYVPVYTVYSFTVVCGYVPVSLLYVLYVPLPLSLYCVCPSFTVVNPRRACARVTVVVLCVCVRLFVCSRSSCFSARLQLQPMIVAGVT